MTGMARYREIVKAVALGDMDKAEQLDDQLSDEERGEYTTFLTAFFCGALEERFRLDQSREAVARFVDEMRHDYRNAEPPIRPLVLEGVIRGILGEEHLLDEVSPQDQLLYQVPVIRKIADQSPALQERLDDYLADAGTMAAEWMTD